MHSLIYVKRNVLFSMIFLLFLLLFFFITALFCFYGEFLLSTLLLHILIEYDLILRVQRTDSN